GERNGWNLTPDRGVDGFRGMMSVGSNHGLKDHLPLVRDRQTVFRRQLAELLVGETHSYGGRMIIKETGGVSTQILLRERVEITILRQVCASCARIHEPRHN